MAEFGLSLADICSMPVSAFFAILKAHNENRNDRIL